MSVPSRFASDSVGNGTKEVGGLDQLLQHIDLHGQGEAVVQHLIQ